MTRVTRTNLIAVAVVSAALIVYAVTGLLQAFVLDDSYPLYVELPDAAGLRENKEVTYNGHPVGSVAAVAATPRGARIEMAIDNGVRIPLELDVVVLRRSPIGEQALDLRPVGPARGVTQVAQQYYEPGATIDINELVLPPEVQELFETVVRVLAPVDAENTGVLVSEVADTVRGRKGDIRRILRDSADLSEAIADEGEEYDELFASSRVVNAELAEHRDTLAGLITDLKEATSILTDGRDEFEQLILAAPPVLNTVGDFVERAQPDLACSLEDFANLNQMTARPKNLAHAAEALRHNRLFFVGFEAITAYDPADRNWFRVHVEGEQKGPPPDSYLPDKRPIKPIWPGGACSSKFGPGAPSATQAGFQLLIPDARIERPANDRTDRRIGGGSAQQTPVTPPQPAHGATPGVVMPVGGLPATGGDPLPLLIFGLITLAAGVALVRREGRRG